VSDLAEVLGELAAQLPRPHLDAWIRVLRETRTPGQAAAEQLIEAKPGYALAAKAMQLMEAWRIASPVPEGPALALALETAARVQDLRAAERTDVAISGPGSNSAPLRLTSAVVTELIRDSRKSLLIVSFAAFGVADVIHELRLAANRDVRIDLVLETTTASGGTLRGTVEASAAFSAIRPNATFWVWPADRRPVINGSRAALHAKLIVADERVALVGSANLTDKALASNLELGVIIRDPNVVQRIDRHFRSLMHPGSGILQRIKT
jgi:phosphatidylserine/phosphatidylglycerophosphate/cardiolipin synthase-like enzyme